MDSLQFDTPLGKAVQLHMKIKVIEKTEAMESDDFSIKSIGVKWSIKGDLITAD